MASKHEINGLFCTLSTPEMIQLPDCFFQWLNYVLVLRFSSFFCSNTLSGQLKKADPLTFGLIL